MQTRLFVLLSLLTSLVLAPPSAPAAPFLPEFAGATFTGAVPDAPYFPMTGNHVRIFIAREDGEVVERFELQNQGPGPVILGVQTFIQRDRAFEEGRLVEDTFDYFAQDTDGNVWYFGEDVTNYLYDEDGNLIGTNNESAWRAGVNGALPGWIMPADWIVGFNYFQEFAPADEAIDQAITSATDLVLATELGTFGGVLRVLEFSELDPGALGFKYYAPGIGLIREEEGLDPDLENPELVFELVRVVPGTVAEPASVLLLAFGLGVLALARRVWT